VLGIWGDDSQSNQPTEMTTNHKILSLFAAAAFLSLGFIAIAQTVPPTEQWQEIQVAVTVKNVDLEKREITVETPLGETVTLEVDTRIKRLNEVKAGDSIEIEYLRYTVAEFRKPTAEERAEPLVILEDAAKRPPGVPPGAADAEMVRAVVTIEALNRITQTATVKGPLGRYLTVRVADPKKLEQVRLGETVVVTYADSLVVSLNPSK
jgi:hypothetical protein